MIEVQKLDTMHIIAKALMKDGAYQAKTPESLINDAILAIHEEADFTSAMALMNEAVGIMQANIHTPSPDVLQENAQTSLQETLESSIIPQDYWPEIELWLAETRLSEVYLDSKDRIGAWWAAREIRHMGYALNFNKCGIVPSEWYPTGPNWDMAQVEARYRLVASWETLAQNDALLKID